MSRLQDVVSLVGRVLLASLFVPAGFAKIGGFEGTVASVASKGLPLPEVGAALAVAVELGGGLMLALGWKARWAALVVAVFTFFASIYFHNYWAMAEAAVRANQLMFMKNIAIIGGLLMVFAFGPGRYSVDRG